jgi:hypothetical protein
LTSGEAVRVDARAKPFASTSSAPREVRVDAVYASREAFASTVSPSREALDLSLSSVVSPFVLRAVLRCIAILKITLLFLPLVTE